MIKNTIKTLALFVAIAFAQTTVIPAAFADDDFSRIQKIDKEKKAKQENEKAREAVKKAREAAKKAQWAAKHQSGSKPVTAPVIKPVTPVPVVKPVVPAPVPVVKPVVPAPVPVVKPVVPAPVTPVPVVKPVVPAPVTPVPVVKPVVPAPVVKPVVPAPVVPVPVVKPVIPAPVPTVPAIDGAALYTQKCAGCHGSSMRGKSVAATQSAISKNTGGMSSLSSLTAAQLTAISQY